jgi:hypothetical protein
MSDDSTVSKESSVRREWRNLALWLIFMLALFGLAFFDDSSRGVKSTGAPLVISYVLGVIWLVRAAIEWARADPRPLSPIELKDFQSKLHGSATARYSIAVVLLCGAIFIVDAKPNAWWLGVFLALWAAVLAREISFLFILVGGGYLLFTGLASIPVSVAIIIGALIIASAMRR